MKMRLALAALLFAACNTAGPELLPPPFGPNGRQPARLFFPTGLAVAPDGTLLVANGNFNHAFDAGTVASIRKSYLDTLFSAHRDCDVAPPAPAGCDQANADVQFADAIMIGNYAGPLVLDSAGTTAFTGSRDSGKLNAVRVAPGGALSCPDGAGDNAARDCRAGLVDLLKAANLDGPYSIVRGDSQGPGQAAPRPVLFVSSVVPHIDQISAGTIFSSSNVAALDMQNPAQVLFTMSVASQFVASGDAVGPMAFDGVRRQLYLSGCYERFASGGAGEPGSGICLGQNTNLLRIVNVDAQGAAFPTTVELFSDVQSTQTTQLLLADPDPSGMPMTLWATMRGPDALVQIQLPAEPSVTPRVRRAVPLPISPADMTLIKRAGGGPDLIAIVAEKLGAVAIYDTAVGRVVAQVERLGNSPFTIQQLPCPAGEAADSVCLATSVFQSCSVGLIELHTSTPSDAQLRARVGSCP
ncbi:MAG TPA: hypothetical protein VFL36_21965 [Myxococcales bacterium]|nr:hypothetical protein [Myxococcales bacterium]